MLEKITAPDVIKKSLNDISSRFDFDCEIKKGGNGFVFVGSNRITGQRVVVKYYYWGGGNHLEPRYLCEINSKNTLNVLDAASIDEDYAYFVTDYCHGGDLDEKICSGKLGVKESVDIIIDIATGANDNHAQGFIHRDLKPSNIMCKSGDGFVIGDFGSLVKMNQQGYAKTASKHSLIYRTPEEASDAIAYPQGDIYQIGIVLFQLLGGRLPYEESAWLSSKQRAAYQSKGHPDNQIYATGIIEDKIKLGRILDYSSLPVWVPDTLKKVIRKCCKVNRDDRYKSASELIVHLNNMRSSLPDWRFEELPTLYKGSGKIRLVPVGDHYFIEKKAGANSSWRRQNRYAPMPLRDMVALAEGL